MKKVLLSVLVVAGLSITAAQAQSTRFGLKAGASLTSYVGGDVEGAKYKAGFHGGGVAELGITNSFALQPEVLFSMKGAKDSDGYRENLSYIDIPILLKLKADGLFFELGPQVGYLVSAKAKYEGVSMDIKDSGRSFDVGYAAGLGYQAVSGPMVGLRYNGGFSKIGEGETIYGNKIEAANIRNSAFQLYVGYMFGGK